MWKDPIVEEVRQASEELARRAGYDFNVYINNLRENEKKSKAKVVSRVKDKVDKEVLEIAQSKG
jgi:hypothetical protein